MGEHVMYAQIAFTRRAIDEGRGCIGARSLDMLVGRGAATGLRPMPACAAGGRRRRAPYRALHRAAVAERATFNRQKPSPTPRPLPSLVRAMQVLWFGCDICLTSLAVMLLLFTGTLRRGWFA
jgi:hypothetical protein